MYQSLMGIYFQSNLRAQRGEVQLVGECGGRQFPSVLEEAIGCPLESTPDPKAGDGGDHVARGKVFEGEKAI